MAFLRLVEAYHKARLISTHPPHGRPPTPRLSLPYDKLLRRSANCRSAAMPTVLKVGPYRLFFYSGDGHEPPHIHIERDQRIAKFCLRPVKLAEAGWLRSAEIREIERIVLEHNAMLLEA